jgi:hypothetical protein
VKTVLIDRYGAPDEVARAVLAFPTSSFEGDECLCPLLARRGPDRDGTTS